MKMKTRVKRQVLKRLTTLKDYTKNKLDFVKKWFRKFSKKAKTAWDKKRSKVVEWFEASSLIQKLNNLFFYKIKRRVKSKAFLSRIQPTKFPVTERQLSYFPKDWQGRVVCIVFLFAFLFITDVRIKQFLFINFGTNINGVGSLGNLGSASWQVLATVVSVGLATIGIILQAISSEKTEYKRKLLLHHFFSTQQLDNKIFLSFLALFISGLILLFKEKLFFYSFVSEHIYLIFILVGVFIFLYCHIIIKSFDYLFPEKKEKYFREALKRKLSNLTKKSAASLSLIDYLDGFLQPLSMGIKYYFEDNEKKNPNIKIIETREKGAIEDIDLMLLEKISKRLTDKFVSERDGHPLKAEIYIEFGKPGKREYQPLVKIHKDNYSLQIEQMFKRAIILSQQEPPPLETDLKEFMEWAWGNIHQDLLSRNIISEKDNFKFISDFFEDALSIFAEYKKRYSLKDGSSIDKWELFTRDLRRQFFVILDSVYLSSKQPADPLFSLNHFPFTLMQQALTSDNKIIYSSMSDMVVWVYKKIFNFDNPRKKDLMMNFLLVNKEHAEYYILGTYENFKDRFEDKRFYLEVYLRVQINLLKVALKNEDKETIKNVFAIVGELIRHSSYREERGVDSDFREEESLNVTKEFDLLWKALALGIFSWAIEQYEKEKITKEMAEILMGLLQFESLYELSKAFSISIKRDLDQLMQWDWWETEEKEEELLITRGGSFGGFEASICKGYSLYALKLISQIMEDKVGEQQRLIQDEDSYFNLLIGENGTIFTFLNNLVEREPALIGIISQNIDDVGINIGKFKNYLYLTKQETEAAHQQRVIQSNLDPNKIIEFKEKVINGYEASSILRKLFKSGQKLALELDTKMKPFYGIHTLIDKEAFVGLSTISYSSMASRYGEQLAEFEDYSILKAIIDNKKIKAIKLFDATKLQDRVDRIIENIPENERERFTIFILGSVWAEESITRGSDFTWSTNRSREGLGTYKGIKVFANRTGEYFGVIILNIQNSLRLIQKAPDVDKGEMVGSDNHISFLVEQLSEADAVDIQSKQKTQVSLEKIKEKVRFWCFACLEVKIEDPNILHKILIQSDEIKRKK